MVDEKNKPILYKISYCLIAVFVIITVPVMVFCTEPGQTLHVTAKVLILLLTFFLGGAIFCFFIKPLFWRRYLKIIGMMGVVVALTSVYMFNWLDPENQGRFYAFQLDSESLVTDPILVGREDGDFSPFGLGSLIDYRAEDPHLIAHKTLNGDGWKDGFNTSRPEVAVSYNGYTKIIAAPHFRILFKNGKRFKITQAKEVNGWIYLTIDAPHNLTPELYGPLDQAVFISPKGKVFPPQFITKYSSQVGLQGYFFYFLSKVLGRIKRAPIQLVAAFLTAFVASLIVWFIKKRFDTLMAVCFMMVFALSPWIVNFARNMFWVEGTWFLPMLFGLLLSLYNKKRSERLILYFAMFLAILIKSLCGYEYLSTIILGGISFPLFDLLNCLYKKDAKKVRRFFRMNLCLGFACLLGFLVALLVHAAIVGNGDSMKGLNFIYHSVAERRIGGNGVSDPSAIIKESLEVPVGSVLKDYFTFKTQIIAGLPGSFFKVLVVLPIFVLVVKSISKKKILQEISLYLIFFVASISWFILAKPHSYIHQHMNYVLWYFGFVQVCMYIILKPMVELVRNARKHHTSSKD